MLRDLKPSAGKQALTEGMAPGSPKTETGRRRVHVLPPDAPGVVQRALAEDIGSGDITSRVTVPEERLASARLLAKAPGILAGLPLVEEVFRQLDPGVLVTCEAEEGGAFAAGTVLCRLQGPARSLLAGERVALNFVQRLSGIATRTRRFVELVVGTKARIVDTRKTTPGLRSLERYAVRAGGGFNHRTGLYDAVLIKDNHIVAAGGISRAVEQAYAQIPHTMTVTVECDTLDQVREAVEAGVDIVLLDNMSPEQIALAVDLAAGRAAVEASGGVTEATVAAIAHAGADIISVGGLTHSAPAIDIGMDLTCEA